MVILLRALAGITKGLRRVLSNLTKCGMIPAVGQGGFIAIFTDTAGQNNGLQRMRRFSQN
jgi:hypothetical protein